MGYDLTRLEAIAHSLDSMQNECMVTLALKIVDDTCKMDEYERSVFMQLFDVLPQYKSDFFDSSVFDLIKQGRQAPTAMVFGTIAPLRKAGMEFVGRPNMKAFKAFVRNQLKTA